MLRFTRSRSLVLTAVAAFLSIIALQLTLAARANSCTWDDADHTCAGYMQWKAGDFGLNPEHPPLVKFLATLPLLRMPPASRRRSPSPKPSSRPSSPPPLPHSGNVWHPGPQTKPKS